MDIEEYLRQKKELEAKKQLLEAKEKLKEVREPVKERPKPKPAQAQYQPVQQVHHAPRAYHEEPREINEPTLKPWMIWDFLVLLIVLTLFSVTYFFPRVDANDIKADILDDVLKADITGKAVSEIPAVKENTDEESETIEPEDEPEPDNELDVEQVATTKKPGPRFMLQLKDPDAGIFDENGKINNKILDITGDDYYDFDLLLTNKEDNSIVCKLDKEIDIYGNFDTTITAKDVKPDYQIEELDNKEVYTKRESAPGDTEVGTYGGKGSLVGKYSSRCYFCMDKECESYDQNTEKEESAIFKVILRGKAEVNLSSV